MHKCVIRHKKYKLNGRRSNNQAEKLAKLKEIEIRTILGN